MSKIDFEHAKLLMDTIVAAGQHGPMYQKLASMAGAELKQMIEAADPGSIPRPQVVTPAAGPPNSLIEQEDGSFKQVPPAPLPSGVRDEAPLAPPVPPTDNTRVPEARPGMSIPAGNQPEHLTKLERDERAPNEPALVPEEPIDRRL